MSVILYEDPKLAKITSKLKKARICKGYTQESLAKKLGVSKVTICGYEKGTRVPSLNIFSELLDILEVEPNYLLGRDTLIREEGTNYTIKLSKEDIKLIKIIANFYKFIYEICFFIFLTHHLCCMF